MDSPTKLLSSPTKALNPLSPERLNQQQPPPQSPSQSADIFKLHHKNGKASSDVQSKVAFLNNLSRSGSPAGVQQQSASASAALQRAILGREEAESALSKLSDQLSEAQSRERRISERLESLLEELQASKERKAHERTIFEKEIRKARKEAFRAGSTLVKTQEDLKDARAEAKGFKDELEAERKSKEKAKQEAFERAYAIAGLTEELEELKARLRTAEAKNNAEPFKSRDRALRKEESSRVSLAEGDLALLATPASRRPKRSADYLADFPIEESQETPTKQTPPKRLRLSDVTPSTEMKEDIQETPKAVVDKGPEEQPKETPEEISEDALEAAPEDALAAAPEDTLAAVPEDTLAAVPEDTLEAAPENAHQAAPENVPRDVPDDALIEAPTQALTEPANETLEIASREASQVDDVHMMRARAMVEKLQVSLRLEKRLRENAEELAEFLRMECQFKRCSCRIVEEVEHFHVHQQVQIENTSTKVKTENEEGNQVLTRQTSDFGLLDQPIPERLSHQQASKIDSAATGTRDKTPPRVKQAPMEIHDVSDEPLITFSPVTGTFQKFPSPVRSTKKHPIVPQMSPVEAAKRQPTSPLAKYEVNQQEEPADYFQPESAVPAPVHLSPTPARKTPDPQSSMTNAKSSRSMHGDSVKRVPLRKEGSIPDQSTSASGNPISREAALAQIRARRGRANTTKRSASAMETSRRAAAAPSKPAPSESARRIPGVHNPQRKSESTEMRNRRDLSAPIRMTHRR